MAVKFDTVSAALKRPNVLLGEELAVKNLWRKNPDLKHVTRFFGSDEIPESHLKFEYLKMTLESYLK